MQDFKVFIGYDSREDIAFQVAKYSIHKHNPNVEVIPLKLHELREQGFYTRADDKKGNGTKYEHKMVIKQKNKPSSENS